MIFIINENEVTLQEKDCLTNINKCFDILEEEESMVTFLIIIFSL